MLARYLLSSCVRPSHTDIITKRLNAGSRKQCCTIMASGIIIYSFFWISWIHIPDIWNNNFGYPVGMSIDIRKSGYWISGPIYGYENSQMISENNKWIASCRWLRRCRWWEMWVDTIILDTLVSLPAAAAAVYGAVSSHWVEGGGRVGQCKLQVSLSCCEWLSTLLLLRHCPPAGCYTQTNYCSTVGRINCTVSVSVVTVAGICNWVGGGVFWQATVVPVAVANIGRCQG